MFRSDIKFRMDRDAIIGSPSFHQVSNLGAIQFKHHYDPELIQVIANKAMAIKAQAAEKRHLNLNYIRAAHTLIPEINELISIPGRLSRLSELAETPLENYPTSIISSIITFASGNPGDGTIVWHADGIPVTELVPLHIEDCEGGELQIYKGHADEGLARYRDGANIPEERIVSVTHQMGYSVVGQLMRLMHRVQPMKRGYRITLNLNLRSVERPFLDDNSLWYLAADNPDLRWFDEYISDMKENVVPAYIAAQK